MPCLSKDTTKPVTMICRSVVLLISATMMFGCSVARTSYKQPELGLPAQWQNHATTGRAVAKQEQWWKNFNDPQLDALIERALLSNNDLAAATVKVRRARLKSGLADTNLTPSVTASADGSYSRNLKNGTDTRSSSISATLSYELDLWGKLAAVRDSAKWEAEATESDRQSTALALIGTTAAAYWQVAYLNQRISLSEASIAYARKTLSLVQAKRAAGAVSALDLLQAEQKVASQRADLTQLLQQRTEARNTMAILFDQAPQNSVAELTRLPETDLPVVEPGIPASLLARRPDLQASELRLREYLADLDSTRGSYYPTFTLTGTFGSTSTSLTNVLQNPAASLGAGLVLPFVQWNTAKLNIKVSESVYEEAVVKFRQTLFSALKDVENALSAVSQYQSESIHLARSLYLAQEAEKLAEARYRAGANGLQTWLDAQETRREAEVVLAQNRLNRLKTTMALYQSLGGDMR